ncbi:MAG: alpha-L-fucosidase [Soonwooa sp.]
MAEVVSKGGNLMLGTGFDGNGVFPEIVQQRLQEIGEWMQINGDAICGTKPIKPYSEGKIRLTQKVNSLYGIYLLDENETLPEKILFSAPKEVKSLQIL